MFVSESLLHCEVMVHIFFDATQLFDMEMSSCSTPLPKLDIWLPAEMSEVRKDKMKHVGCRQIGMLAFFDG